METRSDLKKFISRLKPEVRLRIQKVADSLGLTFDDVVVSLYSRFECDLHNVFYGHALEIHSTCVFRHRFNDKVLIRRRLKRSLKNKDDDKAV